YKQSTRYTYLIENIGNYEKVLSRFSSAKQRQLRKAEKAEFSFEFDLKPDEFYALHKQFLASRKEDAMIDYSYLLFLRLWKVATTRKQGQIFALRDKQGNLHCAHFIVWDSISAYDLLYFINPSYASSGASTLVIANILKWLNGKTRSFDFEGSMIESVENSYRQFGTVQKAYFQIHKAFNPLAGWLINWKKH
ncbi:MAG: GNAT family N-acetyltransferase, partial [Bacteroidaceae bacterium]|nr:GNAT family N-acetyltransferase [Bacteroidaceae bacterium]